MPDYWNKWQKSIEIAMQTEVINKEYLVGMMRKLKFKDPIIFEKSVHAFILLSELLKYYPDLIFKGGTAILFYKFPPLRFSIDIDVILEYEEKENLSKRLGKLVQNSQFFENSEPDIREGEIPKEHYKFYYHSLFTDKEEYVLLDVIFCANPYYRVLQKSLADLPLPSVDQILKVKIPTPEGLLADKMTAISPKTIGIPLNEEREMEFVKQVVDIGLLFNLVDDLGNAVITFDKISEIENGFRKSNYSRLEILDSILDVSFKYCQYQLKGADNKFTEIECLNRGLRKVGNHLVGRYSQNNLKTSFSKVAYMCKVIKKRGNFTFKKEVDSKMVEDKRLKGKFGILELLRKTNLDAYFYWMSGYGE